MNIDTMSLFFIVVSLVMVIYLLFSYKYSKIINILVELLFISIYGFILLIFIFPNILNLFRNIGIKNPINFFVYLSIFILFAIVFYLYKEKEKQRVEITKLVRKIAIMNKK